MNLSYAERIAYLLKQYNGKWYTKDYTPHFELWSTARSVTWKDRLWVTTVDLTVTDINKGKRTGLGEAYLLPKTLPAN
jgi:hypothetical protein